MKDTKSDTECQEGKQIDYWSRYGHVPYALMSAQDIDRTAKVILCYLLTYCGNGSVCWPSQATIAHDLNISERRIRSALKDAEAAGHVKRRQISKGRGKGSYTVYSITCMETYPFRPATDDRSKLGAAKNGQLERPNGTHKYKQENKHSYSNSGKKSIYPDMVPLDEV